MDITHPISHDVTSNTPDGKSNMIYKNFDFVQCHMTHNATLGLGWRDSGWHEWVLCLEWLLDMAGLVDWYSIHVGFFFYSDLVPSLTMQATEWRNATIGTFVLYGLKPGKTTWWWNLCNDFVSESTDRRLCIWVGMSACFVWSDCWTCLVWCSGVVSMWDLVPSLSMQVTERGATRSTFVLYILKPSRATWWWNHFNDVSGSTDGNPSIIMR